MDVSAIREYICENNLDQTILEALGCHHIVDKGNYISCANRSGDKPKLCFSLDLDLNVWNCEGEIRMKVGVK